MAQKQRFGGWLGLAALLAGAAVVQVSAQPSASAATSRLDGDWQAGPRAVIGSAKPSLMQGAPDFGAVGLGAAPSGARLDRILLVLEPSPAQRAALDTQLANQQDPKSSEYHHWLAPSEFADRYANSAADIAAIVSWLQSEGLVVGPVPAGRGWIEFSGTVAQVEQAFQTRVQSVAERNGVRLALAASISVPAALRPLIHGLVSLDGVMAEPAITTTRSIARPAAELRAATSITGADAVTPQLAARMLHLDALHASGATGLGETIAIAARSNLQIEDVAAFRSAFGLPANPVEVVLNGTDPGRTDDETAAVLEASWAGVPAPGARILLVPAATTGATDGLDLSLAAIVDQAIAHTAVVGFSACEASLSEARQSFYRALYRQAAAEGIAVIAASGDSGASACHAGGSQVAITTGFGVNALASTPWNTAVGAAALADAADSSSAGVGTNAGATSLAGWSPRKAADPAYAGGGGGSALYAVPAWQPLPATETAGFGGHTRLMPDIALPTAIDSSANRGLVMCIQGSGACNEVRAGGSAAAAALFAGVAAIVAEKNGAQGNLAPVLYELSRRSGVFDDVRQGNARLVCAAGSPGCDASGKIGFDAAEGYDLATGLGSIDAEKLVNEWARAAATGTGSASVTLSVTPTVPNTTYNPTAQITLTANVVSQTGGPVPTGSVLFADALTATNLNPSGSNLDANGVANFTLTSGMKTGGNNITAIYSGDATYAALTSQPLVVNIQPSDTSLATVPSTTKPTAGLPFSAIVTISVVSPPEGTIAPTGKVTLNVDGLPAATASLTTAGGVTSATFPSVTINAAGGHQLQAVYAGDANYKASTAPAVTVTIGKGATVTALTATPATLTAGVAETFTATIAPANAAAGTPYIISGSVSFYDGTTLLGTAVANANAATLSNVLLSSAVLHTITAIYSGDDSWSASTSNAITLQSVLLPDSVTLAVNINTIGPGQVVTLIATVTPASTPALNIEQNPTGKVIFYNGTTVIGTATLVPSLSNSSTATLTTGSLPGGQNVLTAFYMGDLYFAPGTSNPVTIDVQDFTITPAPTNPPTNLNIIKGSSGSASFIVTGLGGFNNQVQVVCAVPTQDDMTCLPSPQQVIPTCTVTFTVQTFGAGGITASSDHRAPLWPRALGGTALAVLVFFVLPYGRRARVFAGRVRSIMMLSLLLTGLGAAGIGCSSSVTAPPVNDGTPLGVATLKITAAGYVDNTVVSRSVYLTVNVLKPGANAVRSHSARR